MTSRLPVIDDLSEANLAQRLRLNGDSITAWPPCHTFRDEVVQMFSQRLNMENLAQSRENIDAGLPGPTIPTFGGEPSMK
jgi:hypothetical protein